MDVQTYIEATAKMTKAIKSEDMKIIQTTWREYIISMKSFWKTEEASIVNEIEATFGKDAADLAKTINSTIADNISIAVNALDQK